MALSILAPFTMSPRRASYLNVYEGKSGKWYTPSMTGKPKCFVIIQIGKEGSETRKKSDRVLKYIVENALEDKYHVQRADDIRQPGTVTVQIIEQLLEAPLVVADLSDFNANVYYELAIRHAVKKPVVHLITTGQDAPFDVNQMRYVSYDITAPESVEAAREELRDHVAAIEGGATLLTPIQFTQFVLAAQSGQGADRNAGMIADSVSAAMSKISEELKSIKELVTRTSTPPQSLPLFLSDIGVQTDSSKMAMEWLRRISEKKD
jgi:hypothetical protein